MGTANWTDIRDESIFTFPLPTTIQSIHVPFPGSALPCLTLIHIPMAFPWHYTRLGSRMVSVLDSGAEGPGSNWVAALSCNSLRQTVHTHRASVHEAAKLRTALLRVAGVTAGLAESNGSLPPGLWLTSPASWLPSTGINCGTLRSAIKYWLPFLHGIPTGLYKLGYSHFRPIPKHAQRNHKL